MEIDYEIKAKKILKAEELAGDNNNLLIITLAKGSKLFGYSRGIDGEADEKEDMLLFECPELNDMFLLRESQIKDVELA